MRLKLIALIFLLLFNCNKSDTKIISIIPLLQTNNTNTDIVLTNITLSEGTLSPSFSSNTTSYTVSVNSSVSTIRITPTTNLSNSTITVNGSTVISGSESNPISLNFGANTITVIISNNSISRTYSILVTRALGSLNTLSNLAVSLGVLSPSFVSSTTSYTLALANSISSITVTPTLSSTDSLVTVNGTNVSSGSASGTISLSVGSNSIIVLVTSTDGTSTTYTITANRSAATTFRIFVTNATYSGNLGGISGSDTRCNADANKPLDGSTYKAIVVDNAGTRRACTNGDCTSAAENLDWVLKPNTSYIRASDSVSIFTTNAAGIFAYGTMPNSFLSGPQVSYWTGLRADWRSSSNDCIDWTSNSAINNGRVGLSDVTDSTAIRSGTPDCSESHRLLCAEQ
ncbi:MAG: DUF1554 domain-containing protein [Leptospiraceae bacterium]|nr:DUF1554 domain-containing protein [Leptospiraceae bacterium]